MARVLGKNDDARDYFALAERIKTAFNREFFDVDSNDYGSGSQTANALALYLGLVPEQHRDAVRENLVHNIVEENDGHLATGIIGTNALEQVLPELGESEVMYGIATQTTFPSWGDQIRGGATTLWETWQEPSPIHHSLNMKMFGSSQVFFYRHLAGIGAASPGFRDTVIRPRIVKNLDWVDATVDTVRGPIECRWEKVDGGLYLRVVIPANTQAVVHVPTLEADKVSVGGGGADGWTNGTYIPGGAGLLGAPRTTDAVVFKTGGSRFFFRMRVKE